MLFIVCSEAAGSKLVKLETGRTVILSPMVSVLCLFHCHTANRPLANA